MTTRADLLKAALDVVEKRGLTYGKPENNFKRIATFWTDYLIDRQSMVDGSMLIGETDVAAMMVLMKIARLMEKPDHYDSWLDLAGYAACGAEVSGAKAPDAVKPPLDVIKEAVSMPVDWTGHRDIVGVGEGPEPRFKYPFVFRIGARVRRLGYPVVVGTIKAASPINKNWHVAWDSITYRDGSEYTLMHERELEPLS